LIVWESTSLYKRHIQQLVCLLLACISLFSFSLEGHVELILLLPLQLWTLILPNDPLLHSGSSGTPPCSWSLGPCLTVTSSCSLQCLRLLPRSRPSLLVPLSGLLCQLCPSSSCSLKEGHARVVWASTIGRPALHQLIVPQDPQPFFKCIGGIGLSPLGNCLQDCP
jgi:hypothetical protein